MPYRSYSGHLQVFGCPFDLRCKRTDAFERKKVKAAAMLSHPLTQAGSLQPKNKYNRFKIILIILYTAQVSNWLFKQYRSLDAPFTENYRKLLSLLKKTEAIIYLPNKFCGIGLQ
jgi:hypothetical protein